MRKRGFVAFMIVVCAAAGSAAESKESRGKKPRLDLRASPRMAFSPVQVLLTAELSGGDVLEDFHCPELEWDWDDGGKSVQQSDCTPLESGADIERRFTAHHAYHSAGTYNVKMTMRRANRSVAVATTSITVRPGLADMSRTE